MPDPPSHRPQTGRDQTVINRPVVGSPQILAPQANDPALPAPAVHEVKRRKTGPILVLLALIVVAVVAAVAAAYSQFGRDPDAVATPTTESTVSTTTALTTTTPPVTTVDPNALQIVLTEDPFVCDGDSRQLGLISKADPNEEIAFSSPQAGNISPGQAAEDGTLPIRWQCTEDQIGTTWNLTAAGTISGKVAFFDVVGVAPGTTGNSDGTSTPIAPAPDDSTSSTVAQPAGGELTAVVTEDPFVCNGQAREFGKLSGAEPNEEIGFTSPQASGISSGDADANGERAIRWSCTPDQAGTTWELTATGATSGRTVTISFTGS